MERNAESLKPLFAAYLKAISEAFNENLLDSDELDNMRRTVIADREVMGNILGRIETQTNAARSKSAFSVDITRQIASRKL